MLVKPSSFVRKLAAFEGCPPVTIVKVGSPELGKTPISHYVLPLFSTAHASTEAFGCIDLNFELSRWIELCSPSEKEVFKALAEKLKTHTRLDLSEHKVLARLLEETVGRELRYLHDLKKHHKKYLLIEGYYCHEMNEWIDALGCESIHISYSKADPVFTSVSSENPWAVLFVDAKTPATAQVVAIGTHIYPDLGIDDIKKMVQCPPSEIARIFAEPTPIQRSAVVTESIPVAPKRQSWLPPKIPRQPMPGRNLHFGCGGGITATRPQRR
jgi:hypothetical protein